MNRSNSNRALALWWRCRLSQGKLEGHRGRVNSWFCPLATPYTQLRRCEVLTSAQDWSILF